MSGFTKAETELIDAARQLRDRNEGYAVALTEVAQSLGISYSTAANRKRSASEKPGWSAVSKLFRNGGGRPKKTDPSIARHKEHARMRFEAAKAAMQGLLANEGCGLTTEAMRFDAERAITQADALLAELAKPQEGASS